MDNQAKLTMTSTPFNVGLMEGGRMSSRVLRPPGGGHTDIFGGAEAPVEGRRRCPPPSSSICFSYDEPAKTNGTAPEAPAQNGQAAESKPEPEAKVEVSEPDAKFETQTPEPIKEPVVEEKMKAPVPEQPKNEPPKRVRVPPGGFSSGLW